MIILDTEYRAITISFFHNTTPPRMHLSAPNNLLHFSLATFPCTENFRWHFICSCDLTLSILWHGGCHKHRFIFTLTFRPLTFVIFMSAIMSLVGQCYASLINATWNKVFITYSASVFRFILYWPCTECWWFLNAARWIALVDIKFSFYLNLVTEFCSEPHYLSSVLGLCM